VQGDIIVLSGRPGSSGTGGGLRRSMATHVATPRRRLPKVEFLGDNPGGILKECQGDCDEDIDCEVWTFYLVQFDTARHVESDYQATLLGPAMILCHDLCVEHRGSIMTWGS